MGSIRTSERKRGICSSTSVIGIDRCREQTALEDSPANRKKLQKILDRIELEIKLGSFEYARFFPGASSRPASAAPRRRADPARPLAPIAAAIVQRRPAAARPSFSQFAETWQQESAVAWRRSYQRTVRDIVRKHLEPAFGQRDVGSLSREELLQFRSELAKVKGRKKETLSPRRINAVMNVLGLILNEASDRWKFTTPCYNIKPLRLPKSDVEPFTLEEVRLILDRVREDYRDYLLVRFFTGMRTGEVRRAEVAVRRLRAPPDPGARDHRPGSEGRGHQDRRARSATSHDVPDRLRGPAAPAQAAPRASWATSSATAPASRSTTTTSPSASGTRCCATSGSSPRRPYQMRHTAATLWLAAGENAGVDRPPAGARQHRDAVHASTRRFVPEPHPPATARPSSASSAPPSRAPRRRRPP
ncbi:MAG: DUF3596 domain-containing protein [Desulfomicrobium escambiense]|nr:DUF3596 domain-containing protein [Desulfomicrobium escambiense]